MYQHVLSWAYQCFHDVVCFNMCFHGLDNVLSSSARGVHRYLFSTAHHSLDLLNMDDEFVYLLSVLLQFLCSVSIFLCRVNFLFD